MQPNYVFLVKNISSIRGGCESSTIALIQQLIFHGRQVTLYTFESPSDFQDINLPDELVILFLNLESSKRSSLFSFIHSIRQLYKSLPNNTSNLYFGVGNLCYTLLSIISFIKCDLQVSAIEHTVPRHYLFRPIQLCLISLLSWRYQHFFVVSNVALRQFKPLILCSISILPNSLNYIYPHVHHSNVRETIFLCVGRLSSEKRPLRIASSFSSSGVWKQGWKLYFIGDGPLRTKLTKYVRQLPAYKSIDILGSVDNIFPYLLKSSYTVQGSMYESLGLSFLESLACGVPCIVSNRVTVFRNIAKSEPTANLFYGGDVFGISDGFHLTRSFRRASSIFFSKSYKYISQESRVDFHNFSSAYLHKSPYQSFLDL